MLRTPRTVGKLKVGWGANGKQCWRRGTRSGTYGRDPRLPGAAGADYPIGRVSGVTAREEAKARVQPFGRTHSHVGLRRLDDAGLLSKLVLDQKILANADSADCAAFSRGQVSGDRLHVMLSHLEESDVERW
jgi:hypothetical protein